MSAIFCHDFICFATRSSSSSGKSVSRFSGQSFCHFLRRGKYFRNSLGLHSETIYDYLSADLTLVVVCPYSPMMPPSRPDIRIGVFFFEKMGQLRPLFRFFGFLRQTYVKNVHPVYGAGIRTHDLRNVSLFP